MCGIAGILAPTEGPVEARVNQMVDALHHRGPDANAVVQAGRCTLGHARLKIIDFEGGAQPMASDEGRFLLSFNGEIFNFQTLREELEKEGIRHETRSDTEVLLRLLIQSGKAGLSRLNGQFAFLFWDEARQQLLAGRDQKGEKPLFWTRTRDGELVFASEVKALLALPNVDRKLCPEALDAYFRLNYIPPHLCAFANIQAVRPGTFLECNWSDEKGWLVESSSYWKPAFAVDEISEMDEAALIERIRSTFHEAIGRSMISDAPLGAFLSGGLDSSTIVAAMRQQLPEGEIKTFSVGFGDEIDELPYARAVSDRYQTEHREIQMDLDVGELLEQMAVIYDEPFADSSNIPTYAISKVARSEVAVALSGDGGDELFGGYRWYVPLLLGEDISGSAVSRLGWNLASLVMRVLCRVAGNYIPKDRRKAITIAQELNLRVSEPDLWRRHVSRIAGFDRAIDGSTAVMRDAYRDSMAEAYLPSSDVTGIDRATWFDLTCYLSGDILKKVDMATMAVSLESRAPFLDQEFLQLMLAVPGNRRFRDGKLKPMMREAFARDWPAELRDRPKQGFGAPVSSWLKRPDVRAIIDRVLKPGSVFADAMPQRAQQLRTARGQDAWQLLCLALWLEQYQPTEIA